VKGEGFEAGGGCVREEKKKKKKKKDDLLPSATKKGGPRWGGGEIDNIWEKGPTSGRGRASLREGGPEFVSAIKKASFQESRKGRLYLLGRGRGGSTPPFSGKGKKRKNSRSTRRQNQKKSFEKKEKKQRTSGRKVTKESPANRGEVRLEGKGEGTICSPSQQGGEKKKTATEELRLVHGEGEPADTKQTQKDFLAIIHGETAPFERKSPRAQR